MRNARTGRGGWVVSGGTPAQRAVVRLAVKDLTSAVSLPPRGDRRQIVIDDEFFTGHRRLWLGYQTRRIGIRLSHLLTGNQLYAIALHELGHELGIGHRRAGIMQAYPMPGKRRLTRIQRYRWVLEVLKLAATVRPSRRRLKFQIGSSTDFKLTPLPPRRPRKKALARKA